MIIDTKRITDWLQNRAKDPNLANDSKQQAVEKAINLLEIYQGIVNPYASGDFVEFVVRFRFHEDYVGRVDFETIDESSMEGMVEGYCEEFHDAMFPNPGEFIGEVLEAPSHREISDIQNRNNEPDGESYLPRGHDPDQEKFHAD